MNTKVNELVLSFESYKFKQYINKNNSSLRVHQAFKAECVLVQTRSGVFRVFRVVWPQTVFQFRRLQESLLGTGGGRKSQNSNFSAGRPVASDSQNIPQVKLFQKSVERFRGAPVTQRNVTSHCFSLFSYSTCCRADRWTQSMHSKALQWNGPSHSPLVFPVIQWNRAERLGLQMLNE